MMKKLSKIVKTGLCAIIGFAFLIGAVFGFTNKKASFNAFAENTASQVSALNLDLTAQIKGILVEFLDEGGGRIKRETGLLGEGKAADFIFQKMSGYSTFSALDNSFFELGVQNFDFENVRGEMGHSQNIAFKKASSVANSKTVVLMTHYDNLPYGYESGSGVGTGEYQYSQGINSSAGGVAMLLALADYIDQNAVEFDYNLQIVFVGANYQNYAGAEYFLKSISQTPSDYAVIINFDQIAVGEFNYVFCQDFDCEYASYIEDLLVGANNFKKYNKTNSIAVDDANRITHRGLKSGSSVFIESGINVANIFSGYYSGLSDIKSATNSVAAGLSNSASDTISDIESLTSELVSNNLSRIANAMMSLLQSENFAKKASAPANLKLVFDYLNNEKMFVFVIALVSIILFVVYYAVYDNLLKNSRKQMGKQNLNAVVMKIQTEVGDVNSEIKEKIKEKIDNDVNGKME